jgi:hypothetical protein
MNDERWLTDPAAPLRAFSQALGDWAPDWAAREELEQLRYRREDFSRDVAAGLTLEQLRPLAEAYGDALRCRFLLGAMPALEVGPDLDAADLDEFRAITEDSPTVVFDFALNKRRLLQSWLGEPPGRCRPFLYLFPDALERLLKIPLGRLRDLEKLLWAADPAQKVLILVPDHDIWLDGPYLALVGGERVVQWRQVLSQEDQGLTDDANEDDDGDPLRFIVKARASTLKWDQPWVDNLTPLHLKLEGEGGPDGVPIATLLKQHLVNLVMLYTADRSLEREGELLATYAGAQHSVEVPLLKTDQLCSGPIDEGAHALLEIFEWAYDPNFSVDRLPLVQVGVARALHAADAGTRCRLLLHNAPAIYDNLQYHWKALIEDKVDAYVTQVRALEDYVGETARAFADQVTKMIDDLTKNMLAAVGVVVGSFIGSLFKDTFNPAIFSLGMFVYALYVAVFPLAFGMINRREEYEALKEEFADRRERFEALLYRTRVKEIIGDRIRDSQERFERWFSKVKYAYVTLIVLAVVAGIVALVIFGPESPATTTTSPAATPTIAGP